MLRITKSKIQQKTCAPAQTVLVLLEAATADAL